MVVVIVLCVLGQNALWSPDEKIIAFDGLTRAQTLEAWSESRINLVSVADGTITQLNTWRPSLYVQ
jgi:hypothetical protein